MRCESYFFSSWKRPTIILMFSLMFAMSFPFVTSTYVWHTCSNDSTYTNGSTYSYNLDQLLSKMLKNAPQSSGFNTSAFGQAPDKVYGLLQCSGGISAQTCSNCALEANSSVQDLCSNDSGAMIWLDDCFLRYNKTNFTSILDPKIGITLLNTLDITQVNLNAAKGATFALLSDLIVQAGNPSNMGFASAESKYTSTLGADGKVYGLVQCWRDISMKDCTTCLSYAMTKLEKCCYTKNGAQYQSVNCKLRFEIYPFFDSVAPAPISPPPSISPTLIIY